jgi:hypothetical protein
MEQVRNQHEVPAHPLEKVFTWAECRQYIDGLVLGAQLFDTEYQAYIMSELEKWLKNRQKPDPQVLEQVVLAEGASQELKEYIIDRMYPSEDEELFCDALKLSVRKAEKRRASKHGTGAQDMTVPDEWTTWKSEAHRSHIQFVPWEVGPDAVCFSAPSTRLSRSEAKLRVLGQYVKSNTRGVVDSDAYRFLRKFYTRVLSETVKPWEPRTSSLRNSQSVDIVGMEPATPFHTATQVNADRDSAARDGVKSTAEPELMKPLPPLPEEQVNRKPNVVIPVSRFSAHSSEARPHDAPPAENVRVKHRSAAQKRKSEGALQSSKTFSRQHRRVKSLDHSVQPPTHKDERRSTHKRRGASSPMKRLKRPAQVPRITYLATSSRKLIARMARTCGGGTRMTMFHEH